MSQTIEVNLVDVLTRLENKIDKLDSKIDKLTADVNDIKVQIATLDEGQKGLGKRLENLEFISRAVIGGIMIALLVGFAKMLYPNLNF